MKYFIDSTVAINLRDGRGVPYTFINKIDFAKERVMISDYSLFELSGYCKRDLYPQFKRLLSKTNELYIATIYENKFFPSKDTSIRWHCRNQKASSWPS
jgi:hypothetical protein